jgi:hypothetical protein
MMVEPVRDDSELDTVARRLFNLPYISLREDEADQVWNEIEENES